MSEWKDNGALSTVSGGTGLTSHGSGDLLYGSGGVGAAGLLALPIGAANTILLSDGAGPSWVGAWGGYTPTFVAAGGGAAIGNGTIAGRWNKRGKVVLAQAVITGGSTTNWGTGAIQIGLPSTAVTTLALYAFVAQLYDASAGRIYPGSSQLYTAASVSIYEVAGGIVTSVLPFTFAVGDQIAISATYEEA